MHENHKLGFWLEELLGSSTARQRHDKKMRWSQALGSRLNWWLQKGNEPSTKFLAGESAAAKNPVIAVAIEAWFGSHARTWTNSRGEQLKGTLFGPGQRAKHSAGKCTVVSGLSNLRVGYIDLDQATACARTKPGVRPLLAHPATCDVSTLANRMKFLNWKESVNTNAES
jgi:hypothetical protein